MLYPLVLEMPLFHRQRKRSLGKAVHYHSYALQECLHFLLSRRGAPGRFRPGTAAGLRSKHG